MINSNISRQIDIVGKKLEDFPRCDRLQLKKNTWNRIWSCYSAIKDTDEAIGAYLKNKSANKEDIGLFILKIYGYLQALYVQQDAVKSLVEELRTVNEVQWKFELRDYPGLQIIRDVRNDITGHPTDRNKRRVKFYFALNLSMSSSDSIFYHEYADNNTEYKEVNTTDLFERQHGEIINIIERIINELETSERLYKEKFKGMRLVDLLKQPQYPSIYHLIDATGNIDQQYNRNQARIVLDELMKSINKVRAEIKKRQITLEGINKYRDDLDYASKKLKSMLSEDNWQSTDPRDAKIFAYYIKTKYEEIIKWAKEIDDYYCS